jgi:hypothetical protein
MIDHVAIVEAKESKGAVEWRGFLEMQNGFVQLSSLEYIHHGKIDVQSKENEKVDW